ASMPSTRGSSWCTRNIRNCVFSGLPVRVTLVLPCLFQAPLRYDSAEILRVGSSDPPWARNTRALFGVGSVPVVTVLGVLGIGDIAQRHRDRGYHGGNRPHGHRPSRTEQVVHRQGTGEEEQADPHQHAVLSYPAFHGRPR